MQTRFVAMECSVKAKKVEFSNLLWWVVYAESEMAAVSVIVGTQPDAIRFDKPNLYVGE